MEKNLRKRLIQCILLLGLIPGMHQSLFAQCADGCDDISALDCQRVVLNLPVQLNFGATASGIQDKNDLGTGFTMVQSHSEARLPEDGPASCSFMNGYEPSRLLVSNGNFTLSASKGIAYLDPPASSRNNSQINTIGLGFETFQKHLIIDTKILNSNTGQGFAQAGLWFGIDEDNFVKFAVVNDNMLELRVEANGASTPLMTTNRSGLDLLNKDISFRLDIQNGLIQPTVTAYYTVDNGAEQTLGTLDLPQIIYDGVSIAGKNNVNFAGVYASYRNGSSFDVTFDQFSITEVAPQNLDVIQVNFGSSSTAPPSGWLSDYGQAYGPRTGTNQGSGNAYGWVMEADHNTPMSLEGRGRKRNAPADILQASLMHMQLNGVQGAWEIMLENGTYTVEISVGDGGGFTDSRHTVRAEGTTLIDNFKPSPSEFRTATATVVVADGKLTLDALGGQNTKINSVIISKSNAQPQVTAFNLNPGQAEVSVNTTLRASQISLPNGALDPSSVGSHTVKLFNLVNNAEVNASVSTQNNNTEILLTPLTPLNPSTNFEFRILGGVKDITGAAITPIELAFTTEAVLPPPPNGFVLNINFQDAETNTPQGWIPDFGQAYGINSTTADGQTINFGWVDGLDRSTPLNLSTLGSNTNQGAFGDELIEASFMPMQANDNGTIREGIWEASVPNGRYIVTVTVGDLNVFDSEHQIRVEGVTAIDAFTPSLDVPLKTETVSAMVADGKLTIDAFGGANTKIVSVRIRSDFEFPEFTWKYKFNFQLPETATPEGYIGDTGNGFGLQGNINGEDLLYGWVDGVAQTPLDNSSQTRNRNQSPTELYTITHLQNPNDAHWQMNLPNGLYQVKVAVGDVYSNSTHLINVEGVNVVTFHQEAANTDNGFYEGMTVVEVKDGTLNLDPAGGTNTKLSYLWIGVVEPENDNIPPSITLNIDGVKLSEGVYRQQALLTFSAFDLGGAGLNTLEFNINAQGWLPYTNVLLLDEVGTYQVQARATDANGNTKTTDVYTIEILDTPGTLAKMVIENMDHFPNDYELTFSRIQEPWYNKGPLPNANHDVVFLRIHNRGLDDLHINSIVLSDPANWMIERVGDVAYDQLTFPLTLGPTSYQDVRLKFIAVDPPNPNRGKIKILQSNLTITSDDLTNPQAAVTLRGLWQKFGEGSREPIAGEIIEAFGFTTDPGFENYKHGSDSTTSGDEVLISLLERVDPSRPVTVRQMGSYQGCCQYGAGISYEDGDPYTQKSGKGITGNIGIDTQTLLPRIGDTPEDGNLGRPSLGAFNPAGPFNLRIGGDCSNPYLNHPSENDPSKRGYIGIRFWKVRNSSGEIVPNAYIFSNDYLGSSGTNYDYNDNFFYIENVRPVGGINNHSMLVGGNGIPDHPLEKQSAIDFFENTLGTALSQVVHLRSLGLVQGENSDPEIIISSIEVQGANPDEFIIDQPGDLILSPQESTTLNVTFAPNKIGVKQAVLLVHYNSADSPLRIPLSGVGMTDCESVTLVKRIKKCRVQQ